jgi:hypothetical protein
LAGIADGWNGERSTELSGAGRAVGERPASTGPETVAAGTASDRRRSPGPETVAAGTASDPPGPRVAGAPPSGAAAKRYIEGE